MPGVALRVFLVEPRRLEHVGYGDGDGVSVVDGDRDGLGVTRDVLTVGDLDNYGETGLALEVQSAGNLQLAILVDLEQSCIGATEGIGEGVLVGIGDGVVLGQWR